MNPTRQQPRNPHWRAQFSLRCVLGCHTGGRMDTVVVEPIYDNHPRAQNSLEELGVARHANWSNGSLVISGLPKQAELVVVPSRASSLVRRKKNLWSPQTKSISVPFLSLDCFGIDISSSVPRLEHNRMSTARQRLLVLEIALLRDRRGNSVVIAHDSIPPWKARERCAL